MSISDWHSLGEVPYRKFPVYETMGWADTIQIEDYIVCGSNFGGPLALFKSNRKTTQKSLVSGEVPGDMKSKLSLYTSSGNRIVDIDWDNKKVAGMGWSDREELVVVLEDGNVVMYDIRGKLVHNFLVIDFTTQGNVIECLFWGNGVVAMTADMQIFVAEGIAHLDASISPRKYKLRTGLNSTRPHSSMAIVPPLLSRSGLLEVLLGTEDNSIIVVDENRLEDQHLQDRIGAPVTKMAVAPNGRFLACHQRDGVLTVMSTTFTTKVLDFDTKSTTRPMEITWCGEDAVVLVWRNTGLVMVGPYGDWLNFQYDGAVRLVPEADCCRIITSTGCELLQRVPASTVAIRRIGSTDPGALIYDAMEAFEEGDPKSGENIRSIAASDQLIGAIKSCITAAACEFDVSKQQSLMKAASYGKSFSADADPTEFVETAKKLRVLNEIRKPLIGMPLTMHQLTRLTLDVLISRLTLRNHHLLALRICELLKLKNENVLTHWGCEKIYKLAGSSLSDENIRNTLQEKLLPYGSISYLEMATAAYQKGRRRLATMILDIVQNAVDQIPLLLSMQEEELALQKAVNSEDTDLIYLTLIHVERSRTDYESFYRLVCSHPEAANLLKLFYLSKVSPLNRMVLHKLLIFNKNFLEAGALAVKQSYAQPIEAKDNKVSFLKEAVHIFGQNRDLSAYKTATEDQVELIDMQKILQIRTQKSFQDFTVTETIHQLIEIGVEAGDAAIWDGEIAKIVKRFKLTEKHIWRIKVQSLCRLGAHAALSKLSSEKKSPIGFKPFAVACIKYKFPLAETEKYIDRMTEADDRFELYMELSLYRKAADCAIRMKDAARLQEAGRMCRDPKLLAQIQETLSKLT